ncbi:pyruvate dehydrogenase E1 component subunit alpha [Streptomyces antimycoticus]|uniref:2-oxoisovalerate dehydrogenase subunit alpha n=1 Tax=Streptomyces antimycoticus TaxID=68175 RepID=A0A499UJB3_9ACTN|nr:thiamine pyrophosphate-dependent dehydrogenase E1 component subunit alpha [Streptomyces antimycoticus]BBJ37311.1 pyruvate dehydrogenase E1 component subunit alpha [Streptomyces antimycoticus]
MTVDIHRTGVPAPGPDPLCVLDEDGAPAHEAALPPPQLCTDLYQRMLKGRHFNTCATALARQGRIAVYPSSTGQEACQVGAVRALDDGDWLFPTYRDTVALLNRGIDPAQALALMRGDQHCGYDPYTHRTAPQCTPLATHALHAVGLAQAVTLTGDSAVALALLGDGATSEGDFHEALNFAAVFRAPVVFLVQNNQYAISVPLTRQCVAESLADKAVGYGIVGRRVDGNDVFAVHAVVGEMVERARAGGGPALIEAVTYRLEPHTSADDASRYRPDAEVQPWRARDPLVRTRAYLRRTGLLDDALESDFEAAARQLTHKLKEDTEQDLTPSDSHELARYVYAEPPPHLPGRPEPLSAGRGGR